MGRKLRTGLGTSTDSPRWVGGARLLTEGDRSLVEDQSDCPFSYGLIDGEGRWRIPMGRRYVEVRPFRDGVAEVRLPAEDGSYGGPWVRIDTEGRAVDQPS